MKILVTTITNFLSRKKTITFFICLSGVAVIPLFIHSQFITGPIINATLFFSVMAFGPFEAVLLGLIPSSMALASGLLPLALAPMIPFIIISNAIMVTTFYLLKKYNLTIAIISAAVLKTLFLYYIVSFLMNRMMTTALVKQLSIMMTWPQLITAVVGGIIALAVYRYLYRKISAN